MKRLRSLEMLRGVAALLVVMFHAQTIYGLRTDTVPFLGAFTHGEKGVDLFFVLSGFIITYVHSPDIGRVDRLGNYAFNRFSRIYPAVWIMTILAIVVYSVGFGGADKADKLAPWNIVASALLLPQHGDALVNVTWTLKYELFFYALFSILLMNKVLGAALLVLWQAGVLAASVLVFESDSLAAPYLQSICMEFGIGMGCAMLVLRRGAMPVLGSRALQLFMLIAGTSIFVGGALLQTYGPESTKDLSRVALYGCSAGLIILSLVLAEMDGRLNVAEPLVYLGGASYAIYIVHYSAISLMVAAVVKLQVLPVGETTIGAIALIAVAAAIAFYELVDQPIQRKLRQAWRKRHGGADRWRLETASGRIQSHN